MKDVKSIIPHENIHELIYLIRGQKVMLDNDLAELYQVEVKQLKRQVRRNKTRFPLDFMFQLSREEYKSLRSQNGTLKRGQHAKYLPFAFTEQGVAMLSGVLHSQRAVQVNIMIMRAFVHIRQLVSLNRSLAKRLASIERRLSGHDVDVRQLYGLIQELHESPAVPPIGFTAEPLGK